MTISDQASAIGGTQVTLVDVLAWGQAEQPDASNLDDTEGVTDGPLSTRGWTASNRPG